MRNYSAICCLLLSLKLFPIQAQVPYFTTVFGNDTMNQKAVAIRQLPDGSIYTAGTAVSGIIGQADLTLSKMTANGEVVWTKYYGTPLNDQCGYMIVSADGNIVMTGDTETSPGNTDGWLLKTDTAGNVIFAVTTPESDLTESLSHVQQTSDAGYIALGFKTNTLSGGVGNNCYLVRFDQFGNFQWEQTYGGQHNDVGYMVRQTPDGGYVFTGDAQSFNETNNVDIWVVKTDAEGNPEWDLVIGDDWANGIKSIMVTAQNDYFLTGETVIDTTGLFDIVLARVSVEGELEWYKTWGLSNSTEAAFSALQTDEGNFMITGYSNRFRPGDPIHILLLHADANGNEIGVNYFGGNSIDLGYDIQPSVYGDFLLCGMSYLGGGGKYYVQYTGAPEATFITENVAAVQFGLSLLPNYGLNHSPLFVTLKTNQSCTVEVELYFVSGQKLVASGNIQLPGAGNYLHNIYINPNTTLTSGLYLCTARFILPDGQIFTDTQKYLITGSNH